MRRFILRPLLAASFLALASPAGPLVAQAVAAAPTPHRHAEAIAEARRMVQAMLDERGLPGVSVAVGVHGRVVWSDGFGWADLENRIAVSPASRFRIGSVSKPVTAAALGLLHQRGALDLDAPIQTYVPYFPEKRWPVTVRQVAGHIAGVRHYRGTEVFINRPYPTVRESIGIFAPDTLLFEPGTRYSYSSYGWNLLSAVVEGASGEDFLTFMRREVFEPLGLRSIVAEHMDSILDDRVRYYTLQDGHLLNARYVDNSYKWAGGGFVSNAEDLVRFGMAHLEEGLLSEATILTLWEPQHLRDGESTNYGIGWQTSTDPDGGVVVGHGGSSIGGRARLIVLPADGVVVAMLTNTDHAGFSVGDARQIGNLFAGR
jgi:CubicO group peptidase (beta-lactamase class C family)